MIQKENIKKNENGKTVTHLVLTFIVSRLNRNVYPAVKVYAISYPKINDHTKISDIKLTTFTYENIMMHFQSKNYPNKSEIVIVIVIFSFLNA